MRAHVIRISVINAENNRSDCRNSSDAVTFRSQPIYICLSTPSRVQSRTTKCTIYSQSAVLSAVLRCVHLLHPASHAELRRARLAGWQLCSAARRCVAAHVHTHIHCAVLMIDAQASWKSAPRRSEFSMAHARALAASAEHINTHAANLCTVHGGCIVALRAAETSAREKVKFARVCVPLQMAGCENVPGPARSLPCDYRPYLIVFG